MSLRRHFRFRLYIAGGTQNSVLAIANLSRLCRSHLRGRHEIEVVDVLREPQRALADAIFMTPTLVKLRPQPERKIVGALSHMDAVLLALGLEPIAT